MQNAYHWTEELQITFHCLESDYLIIGSGIIGLSIARALKQRHPQCRIHILEKEPEVGCHGSGRNSGVLHAGFYYTADSLKAKFTREGNQAMRQYCLERGLPMNPCGKVVIAQTEAEVEGIHELYRRGQANGVNVQRVDATELKSIEPNAKTVSLALYSPDTVTVDPLAITRQLKMDLMNAGVQFFFSEGYAKCIDDHSIQSTKRNIFTANKIINAAGLYADKIAKDFGFSQNFTIIPFKGIYLKYTLGDAPIKTNVYPVPNLDHPFLGVHYTVTVNGTIKIGPTAIPAFWRENYHGLSRFQWQEFCEILRHESRLWLGNHFNFRGLAFEEMRKYQKSHLISLAANMLHSINVEGFSAWSKPGIRAQLLDIKTMRLVQDFVVEGDQKSVHVLNAVSPAFTGSLPFGEWVVGEYVLKG